MLTLPKGEAVSVRLLRHKQTRQSTVGTIMVNGGVVLPTIERGWVPDATGLYGKPSVSCVPDGLYELERHHSPSWSDELGGHAYYLTCGDEITVRKTDDCARWGILIHPANHAHQLSGCIAPGMTVMIPLHSHNQPFVNSSAKALEDHLYPHLDYVARSRRGGKRIFMQIETVGGWE